MPDPRVLAYGSWESPISADMIASGSTGLAEIRLDGEDIYWIEARPTEGGRSVIVRRRRDGRQEDCLPTGYNARTRVHEYGGGAYCVADGVVFFSNFADHRLYRVDFGTAPVRITPEGAFHYADLAWDPAHRRILCIREDHSGSGEARNCIVSVPAGGGAVEILMSGRDFYASPRPSPDGLSLAYLAWSHPHMPWDASELWLAPLEKSGRPGPGLRVAGGSGESATEPLWSPKGHLHFVSDRTGWWNVYKFDGRDVRAVAPREAEFAAPQWVFGLNHFAFASPEELICSFTEHGEWRLARTESGTSTLSVIPLPYTDYSYIQCDGSLAVFVAGSPSHPQSVVRFDLAGKRPEVLRRSLHLDIDPRYLSAPEPVDFPSDEGLDAHGLFYPPANPGAVGPAGEKPPLVVMIHGGPTSATSTALRLGVQYYSSRGIAVLDVNYTGSSGYGRAYRERLYGRWGVADVNDCCAGALFLARQGRVDERRLAIRGGSAGGYTVLACLAFRKVFAAGASHFGVSDCEVLVQDTHKFESRYLDSLIGPYPERRDLYVERSPIHHLDGLDRPVVFFQGLDDKVVPPNQAEMMFEALRKRGIPTAYLPFEGEQHGFRKAENIRRALEGEFYFFSRVFGFTPAGPIPPIRIENLPDASDAAVRNSRFR